MPLRRGNKGCIYGAHKIWNASGFFLVQVFGWPMKILTILGVEGPQNRTKYFPRFASALQIFSKIRPSKTKQSLHSQPQGLSNGLLPKHRYEQPKPSEWLDQKGNGFDEKAEETEEYWGKQSENIDSFLMIPKISVLVHVIHGNPIPQKSTAVGAFEKGFLTHKAKHSKCQNFNHKPSSSVRNCPCHDF